LVVLLVSLLCAGAAATQEDTSPVRLNTGNDVLEGIQDFHKRVTTLTRESALAWYTVGYIQATEDSMINAGEVRIPEGVTNNQVYDVVEKYLKDHPETRNLGASFLIKIALANVWGTKAR
jgi:hypothetical protein